MPGEGGTLTALPRVDQRVLAAGTTIRFVLLLAMLPVACLWMLRQFLSPGALVEGPTEATTACLVNVSTDPSGAHVPRVLMRMMGNAPNPLAQCPSSVDTARFWLAAGGTVLVLVAAFALYWWLPAWKARQARLVPVASADPSGELAESLAALTQRAGLSRAPQFMVNRRALSASAVVFGRRGSYVVCLHAGLIARRITEPQMFTAVVLHELAHIRNRDVDVTYGTVALWRVFLLAVLLPYAIQQCLVFGTVQLAGSGSPFVLQAAPAIARNVLLSAFLVALVHLARADILRSRELYADLDAVGWGASPAIWREEGRTPGTGGRLTVMTRAFTKLWHTHPGWAERRRALDDPSALFTFSALQMFLVGAAAMVLADLLPMGMFGLHGRTADAAAGWLTAALVTAVTGIALWRGAVHAVATGRRAPSGLRAGSWLGLGMVVGEVMLYRTGVHHWVAPYPELLLVLAFGAAVTTCWTAQGALLLLTAWRGRTARSALLCGLPVTWCAFAVWLVWWNTNGHFFAANLPLYPLEWLKADLLRQVPDGPLADHTGLAGALAAGYPLIDALRTHTTLVAMGTAMWLLPLIAWTRRHRPGAPRWMQAALPADMHPRAPDAQMPPALRTIGRAALLGTLTSCAALLAAMGCLHGSRPPAAERGGTYALSYVFLWALALATGMIVAAVVAAAQQHHFRLLAALSGAGTALLPAVAGQFLLVSADGCLAPTAVMAQSCQWSTHRAWVLVELWSPLMLGAGVYLAGAGALIAVAAAELAGRIPFRRQRAGVPVRAVSLPSTEGGHPVRRRVTVTVVCGAAVGLALLSQHTAASGPWSGLLRGPHLARLAGPALHSITSNVTSLRLKRWDGRPVLSRIALHTAAYHKAWAAAEHSGSHRSIAVGLKTGCRKLAGDAESGARAHPYPLPDGRRLWSLMLDETRKGSTMCLKSGKGDEDSGFFGANRHFAAAQSAQRQLTTLMQTYEARHAPMRLQHPGGQQPPKFTPVKP
ncbi:M48 family metalloprotease [Streptomyces sp. NPDC001339]|uniref:M48 family metalloprotease n=1 Tax=Streptomyces sp. NPDC001339 TaxID=3364563 RepID=UPI0036B2D71C